MGVPPPLLNFFRRQRSVRRTNHLRCICQACSCFGILFPRSVVLGIFLFATIDAISLSQQPTKLPKRGAIATWALRPPSWLSGALSHALYADAFPQELIFCRVRKLFIVPLAMTDDLGMPDPHERPPFFIFLSSVVNATCATSHPPARSLLLIYCDPHPSASKRSSSLRPSLPLEHCSFPPCTDCDMSSDFICHSQVLEAFSDFIRFSTATSGVCFA